MRVRLSPSALGVASSKVEQYPFKILIWVRFPGDSQNMKKIKPSVFDESLEKTYAEHVVNASLDPTEDAFIKWMESQGLEFVDVKVQPEYKKGKIRTMKVGTKGV